MRNKMKSEDEQFVLMNKLLEEMTLLRLRFHELQDHESSNSDSCDVAKDKLGKDIPVRRKDSIELLLKSFSKIRLLMEEVQYGIRLSSPDAM
jgi:hypothetical protein